MGQTCSSMCLTGDVHTPRDPADKTLESIALRVTKIKSFDKFFTSASDPLNQLVNIHNKIYECEEALISAAAASRGSTMVRPVKSKDGGVELELWNFNEKEEKVMGSDEVQALKKKFPAVNDLLMTCQLAVATLNSSLSAASKDKRSDFECDRGYVFLKGDKTAQKLAIRDVNISIFKLRRALIAQQSELPSLATAFQYLMEELANLGLSDVEISTTEDGSFELDFGNVLDEDKLSPPAQMMWRGVSSLQDTIQEAVKLVPKLVEQAQTLYKESSALVNQLKDIKKLSKELTVHELPKAVAGTNANIMALGAIPGIIRSTEELMQHVVQQVRSLSEKSESSSFAVSPTVQSGSEPTP